MPALHDDLYAELFHDIGHELATLAALVATLRAGEGAPPLRRRLDLVEREVDELLVLVGSATDLDDDPGRDGPAVELRALVGEVVTSRDAASPTSVVLEPGPRVWLAVDPRRLRRIVVNLVENAVRAAGTHGHVEVDVTSGSAPTIRVLDDGPGPGRGVPGARGAGLGIARRLARELAAEVGLRSRPGGGTVAEIALAGPSPESADGRGARPGAAV
jgi:signal transduction histidine kinase